MPSNEAAWLVATQAPLEVKPAPYTPPRENEIVVKNHAVAVNPIDWLLQGIGKGLDSVQSAFDVQKKGVSAKKVVTSL